MPRKRPAKLWWPQMRGRVRIEQGFRCAWCGKFRTLDTCHIRTLGMGGDRDRESDPRNARENLVGLCRPCHVRFDTKLSAEEKAEVSEQLIRFTLTIIDPSGHGARRSS